MEKCRGYVGGTARKALIGAAAGALVGALIEIAADVLPGGLSMASAVDVWPPVLAVAGFLGGAVFSAALPCAGGRRRD